MPVVSIEGNLGSGKTTIINSLIHTFNVINSKGFFIKELTKEWIESGILEKFYEHPEQHAYEFLKTLLQYHKENAWFQTEPNVMFVERSIHSIFYVLMNYQAEEGNLTRAQYEDLKRIYHEIDQEFKIDLIIYVRYPPIMSYTNIKNRAVVAERPINFEYVDKMHEWYEWVFKRNSFKIDVPIIVYDHHSIEPLVHQLDTPKNLLDVYETMSCRKAYNQPINFDSIIDGLTDRDRSKENLTLNWYERWADCREMRE